MLVLWAKQKCSDVFGQTHLPGQSEIRPTCDLLASALLWGQAYGTFPQSVNHHMSIFPSFHTQLLINSTYNELPLLNPFATTLK